MKSIYEIYEKGRYMLILRNQWHKHSNDFPYFIEIGRKPRRDSKEFVLTLLGLQLVLFIVPKNVEH